MSYICIYRIGVSERGTAFMRRLKLFGWIVIYLLMVSRHLGETKDMAFELCRDIRGKECIIINDKEREEDMKTKLVETGINQDNNGCDDNKSRSH